MARMRVGLLESLEKLLGRLECLESDSDIEMLKMELKIIGLYYFKYSYFDLSPHLDKIMNTHIKYVEDQILRSLGKKKSGSDLIPSAKYVIRRICDETFYRCSNLSYQILCPRENISDGDLLEFMDSHIEILNYITHADFITQFILEQVVVLKNKLRLLRDFHFCKARGRIVHERLEYLSTQVQSMAFEIAHLCFTFWAKFDKDCFDIKQSFRLICEIELIEPELQEIFLTATRASLWSHSEISAKIKLRDIFAKFLLGSLTELQNSLTSSVVPLSAQILKEIDILKSYLMEFVPSKDVLACLTSLVNEARFFVYKTKDNTINGAKEGEMQLATCDILEKIESSRKQIEEIHLPDQISDKPVTDGFCYVQDLLHSLSSLMNSMDNSLVPVEHQIGIIQKELAFLNSFFKRNEHESLANLRARAVGLTYDTEYAIHFLRLNDDGLCHHLSLNDVIREIKLIKAEVTKFRERMPDIPTHGGLDDLVVGFEKETQTIINHLTSGEKELDVISITGMPGIGKTTLANKVYNLDTVASHFDVRAWCCVSQEYDLNDLMHNIYSQVIGSKNQKREDDIAAKLKKSLMGKRYLVVLDDTWTIKAWDELRRALPDDRYRSRIIITTRKDEVASYAKSNNTKPQSLNFFTKEESWWLLQMKVFKGRTCPKELVDVGRQIAKKCGGLPLVVVLVAGLLGRVEEKASQWLEFFASLGSHIETDETRIWDIIELSYKNLSEHLKPCFLYFGAFPEDHEIPVYKLIQLWMAEGFVKQIENKRLEDEAEEYLNYLIGSNLVIVSSRGYNGDVRTCRIHDLVRNFCCTKAKEQNFLQSMNPGDALDPAFHSTRRFCFHKRVTSNDLPLKSWMPMPWKSSIQTILCFVLGERYYLISRFLRTVHDGSWVAYKLTLLKVLDLETIVVEKSFLDRMHNLVNLSYLAIHLHGQGNILPESLGGLVHLQTFKVKSNIDLHLPYIFENVGNLRHLHIDHYCSLCRVESDQIQLSKNYENLQTFTTSVLTNHIRERDTLMMLPNLRKLSCRFSESYHQKLPELDFLRHLECLEASYYNQIRPGPCQHMLKLPSSLKQLTISYFRLAWSNISTIAELPQLEALELHQAFEGEEWNVGDHEFLKLKFLKLHNIRFARWKSTADSFPRLEQLILVDCRYLEGVPLSFGDIYALKVIEVKRCNRPVACSVKKIQEEQKEMGIEQLSVHVWNSDSEPKKWYNL